jgi:hypothetical protein
LGAYSEDGNWIDEENIMNFDKSPYDSVGVAAIAELFKQAEEIYPICDESVKPSLFKRLLRLGSNKHTQPKAAFNPCDEDLSAQPSR